MVLNHLGMARIPYRASEEDTLNNSPCPISPPTRQHLYIIYLINGLHCFYPITMSLK